jgi:hypothetical protein
MSIVNKLEKTMNNYIFSSLTYYIVLPVKNYFTPKNILIFIKDGKEILKLNNNDMNHINNISENMNNIIYYDNTIDYDYILFNINNINYKKTNITVNEYNKYNQPNKLNNDNQLNEYCKFNKNELFIILKSINEFIKIYKNYNLNDCSQFLYYILNNDYKSTVSFLDCKLIYNDKMYPINVNNYMLNNNNILSYEFIKHFIYTNTDLITDSFDKKHFFDNYKIYIMNDNICEFHIKNNNYISINKNNYVILHKSINYENTNSNEDNYLHSTSSIIDISNNIIDCIKCDDNDDSDNCDDNENKKETPESSIDEQQDEEDEDEEDEDEEDEDEEDEEDEDEDDEEEDEDDEEEDEDDEEEETILTIFTDLMVYIFILYII